MVPRWVVFWLVGWMLTWPAMFADVQAIGSCGFARTQARSELGFVMLWSAIPIVPWVVAPFLTGFYEHGFQFTLTRSGCEQGDRKS